MCFRFDLKTLPVDFVECLMRFLPTENEVKLLRQYEKERKPLEELSDEDRFMLHFSKVERLTQRMAIMAFLGNFSENIQMLMPVMGISSPQWEPQFFHYGGFWELESLHFLMPLVTSVPFHIVILE